jgi:hypothetical protein
VRRRGAAVGSTGNVLAVTEEPPVDPVDDLIEPIEPVDEPSPRWELPEPTGVPAVDDALAPLVELDDLPTGEHVAYYEAVHRQLQDALAGLDSA